MLFSFTTNALQLQYKHIFTIIKEFNFNNPHLIGAIDNKLELIKFLSKNGNFLNIHPRIEKLCANQKIATHEIVFLKSQAENYYQLDFPKTPHCSLLLISKDKKIEDLLNSVAAQTDINQKVFILKEDSHEMYEAYKINDVVVKKKLGHIDLISNNFKWQKDVNPDFIKRRSDFHGIILKGMVAFEGRDMFAAGKLQGDVESVGHHVVEVLR